MISSIIDFIFNLVHGGRAGRVILPSVGTALATQSQLLMESTPDYIVVRFPDLARADRSRTDNPLTLLIPFECENEWRRNRPNSVFIHDVFSAAILAGYNPVYVVVNHREYVPHMWEHRQMAGVDPRLATH